LPDALVGVLQDPTGLLAITNAGAPEYCAQCQQEGGIAALRSFVDFVELGEQKENEAGNSCRIVALF
jgi:hypothetical protein